MKGIRHLLFWSCELLFLHFISINLVLFLRRYCNISKFMKMNNSTTPRVSGNYADSYAAPANSAHSFPSEFLLHSVPSLLLFLFSAFWPSVPAVWIPATPTSSQLSEPFFFPPSPLYTVTHPLCYVHQLTLSHCLSVQWILRLAICNQMKLSKALTVTLKPSCSLAVWWAALGMQHTQIRGKAGSIWRSIDGDRRAHSCFRHRTW